MAADFTPMGDKIRIFLEKNPGALSCDVRRALGDSAATYVATMAAHRRQITRRREPGGMWRYYPSESGASHG